LGDRKGGRPSCNACATYPEAIFQKSGGKKAEGEPDNPVEMGAVIVVGQIKLFAVDYC